MDRRGQIYEQVDIERTCGVLRELRNLINRVILQITTEKVKKGTAGQAIEQVSAYIRDKSPAGPVLDLMADFFQIAASVVCSATTKFIKIITPQNKPSNDLNAGPVRPNAQSRVNANRTAPKLDYE